MLTPNVRPACSWLVALALVAGGCSDPTAPKSPAASGGVAAALRRTQFVDPLTDAEIAAFCAVVSRFPGGRVPDFNTAASLRIHTAGVPAAKLVAEQRQRFRTALDPYRQAELWKIDPLISEALDAAGVEAEAFAMLVIRISAGWAASAFEDQQGGTRCEPLKRLADRRIEQLCAQLEQIDALPQQVDPQTRQFLAEALVETVALSEFLGLLARVPNESLATIDARRDALHPLLPPVQTVADFERHMESTAQVIPTGYVAP